MNADPSHLRPPRRDRRRRQTRERLVAAAHKLFQENGFRATTVAEICLEADVAYKTFFNHFPSKLEVLLAIESRALEALLERLACVLALEASTRERLLTFFEGTAEEAASAGPMHRELLAELIHSAHTRGDEPEQIRRVVQAIERIVEAGHAQGDIRTDYPVATIADLIRGAYYALVISFGNLSDYPITDRARSLTSLLLEAIEVRSDEPSPRTEGDPR